MRRGVRWRVVVSACAAAVLLAACASEPDDPPADTSPLAEVLGWGMATGGRSDQPEVSQVQQERQRQVEELIATCMAESGFEYVPVPLEQRLAGPYDEAYALDADDFAAQYGYGATTLPPPEEPTDPNLAIVAGLPPDEQQAYRRALWGDAAVGGPATDAGGSGVGCQTWANNEVYDVEPGGEAAGHRRFAELFQELNRLWERIENDPRLAGSDRAWAACMAEAGYPDFDRPHDAQQSVFHRLAQIRADGEPDEAALAALREYERALAPVDRACQEEHVDAPRRAVAYEWEAEFVAEHHEELTAYRDWMAEVGSRG